MAVTFIQPGAQFETTLNNAPSGLVGAGSIGVRILDDANPPNTVTPRTSVGINEYPVGSGHYACTLTAPGILGQYSVLWDTDPGGVATPSNSAADIIIVQATLTAQVIPGPSGQGPQPGPCAAWITGADVQAACPASGVTVSGSGVLDNVAAEASSILYEMSGRQFSGACQKTIRPCRTRYCSTWQGFWSYGLGPSYAWGWLGNAYGWLGHEGPASCGCQPLNQIELGYPVRAIQQVLVDGAVVDPATYRVDDFQFLVRLDDVSTGTAVPRPWPGCQNLALADSQVGTWSVTYTFGGDVPQLGKDAAAALACQLWLAGNGQACQLPAGVTKVTRQGVVVERTPFFTWARQSDGSRRTGIPLVDVFLATYNPRGLRRRAAVYNPDVQRHGRRVNT